MSLLLIAARARMNHSSAALAYAATVLADSPLFYARFSETSGTTCNTIGAASIVGTYMGGCTLGQPSLCGDAADRAVLFDGSTGWINFGAPTALKLASGFTIEAIVKPNGSNYKTVLGYTRGGPLLRIAATSNKLNFLKSQVADRGSSLGALTNGVVYHVAVTVAVDGTTTFFINGSASGTGTKAADYGAPVGPFLVAADQTNAGALQFPFNGTVDEAAFYGTALSPPRILAHAQAAGLAA